MNIKSALPLPAPNPENGVEYSPYPNPEVSADGSLLEVTELMKHSAEMILAPLRDRFEFDESTMRWREVNADTGKLGKFVASDKIPTELLADSENPSTNFMSVKEIKGAIVDDKEAIAELESTESKGALTDEQALDLSIYQTQLKVMQDELAKTEDILSSATQTIDDIPTVPDRANQLFGSLNSREELEAVYDQIVNEDFAVLKNLQLKIADGTELTDDEKKEFNFRIDDIKNVWHAIGILEGAAAEEVTVDDKNSEAFLAKEGFTRQIINTPAEHDSAVDALTDADKLDMAKISLLALVGRKLNEGEEFEVSDSLATVLNASQVDGRDVLIGMKTLSEMDNYLVVISRAMLMNSDADPETVQVMIDNIRQSSPLYAELQEEDQKNRLAVAVIPAGLAIASSKAVDKKHFLPKAPEVVKRHKKLASAALGMLAVVGIFGLLNKELESDKADKTEYVAPSTTLDGIADDDGSSDDTVPRDDSGSSDDKGSDIGPLEPNWDDEGSDTVDNDEGVGGKIKPLPANWDDEGPETPTTEDGDNTPAPQTPETPANPEEPNVNLSDKTWNVAHQLAPGNETAFMQRGIDAYNATNNANFALTPYNNSTWIIDSVTGMAVSQAQMEEINRLMSAKLASVDLADGGLPKTE